MSLVVTQRPSITYLAQTARWNAAKNPIVYKMTRKDQIVASVANDGGGNAELTFTGVDLTAFYEVDDIVMYQSTVTGYGTSGAVLSSTFSGGDTLVVLDMPYTHPVGGYANNLTKRPNYKIEVEIYSPHSTALVATVYKSTNTVGESVIDVSFALKAEMLPDFNFDLSGTTEVFDDSNDTLPYSNRAATPFSIRYRETWTGSAEGQTNDSANVFYAALAAMQIPAANGGNMAIYNIPESKFLTRLDTFVIWRGYPSLISAIINEDISGDVYLDVSGDQSTPDDYSGKLVHFDLNQIADTTQDELIAQIFEDGSPDDEVSEQKNIEVREACDNPVMLLGRNSYGGALQWMFDEKQEYSFDYGNGAKAKRLVLFADNLTLNEWESLQEFITLGEVYKNSILELTSSIIKTSSRIGQQCYVLDTDGSKIGVIVIETRNTTNTDQVKHSFEIEIEFPEVFA